MGERFCFLNSPGKLPVNWKISTEGSSIGYSDDLLSGWWMNRMTLTGEGGAIYIEVNVYIRMCQEEVHTLRAESTETVLNVPEE